MILIDGEVPDDRAAEGPQRPGGRWRRRSRVYVDFGVLVIVVAIAVMLTRDGEAPEPVSAATESATESTIQEDAAREPYPLLIAPASARPGEAVSMVAYRRPDLCGDIELRLDGVRLEHRVTATIVAPYPGWNSVLLTVQMPAAVPREDHRLELFGPLPGAGRGGPRCGENDQRHARMAMASIVVSARRQ